jgi:L,D-transpeptidase ErfK/SrfK
VPIGAPGEFVYQPVKIGVRGGQVYIESHRDIYGYTPALFREATAALERMGLTARVDQALLLSALDDPGGMPTRVSPEPATAASADAAAPDTPAVARAPGEADGDRAQPANDRKAGND